MPTNIFLLMIDNTCLPVGGNQVLRKLLNL